MNASSNTSDVMAASSPLPGLISETMYWRLLGVILGLVIAAGTFATGANVVNITVYLRLGFAESTNISLMALALCDLGIAVTTVSSALGLLLPNIPSVRITHEVFMPYSALPHLLFTRMSSLITTYLSIERYMCVLLPLRVRAIITPKRTFVAMVIIFGLTFCMYPIMVLKWPIGLKYDFKKNRTIWGALPNTNPTVELLDRYVIITISTILPPLTFFLVVLFTILLSLSLRNSKTWRDANRATASTSAGAADEDTKSAKKLSKEEKAIKMIMTIAIVFIVTTIPSCLHMVAMLIVPEYTLTGRYLKLYLVHGTAVLGLNSINSGANVIIYYRMSKKFRNAMLRTFCGKT